LGVLIAKEGEAGAAEGEGDEEAEDDLASASARAVVGDVIEGLRGGGLRIRGEGGGVGHGGRG
jgi:hypothetical protein